MCWTAAPLRTWRGRASSDRDWSGIVVGVRQMLFCVCLGSWAALEERVRACGGAFVCVGSSYGVQRIKRGVTGEGAFFETGASNF